MNTHLTEFLNNYPNNLNQEEQKTSHVEYLNDLEFKYGDRYHNSIPLLRKFQNANKNYNNHHIFTTHIYSKNSFLKEFNFNKKIFVELLLNKSNSDIKKTLQGYIYSFKKAFTEDIIINKYSEKYNDVIVDKVAEVVRNNYDVIIEHIYNNIVMEDDLFSVITDMIFNKEDEIYTLFINLVNASIKQTLLKKRLTIDSDVISHLLRHMMRYNNEMFGVVYQTNKYMSTRIYGSHVPFKKINNQLRKLEMIGVLDYVTRNTTTAECELQLYIDNLTKSSNYSNISMRMIDRLNSDTLLFPALNIPNLIDLMDYNNPVIREKFIELMDKISYKIFRENLNEIFDKVRNNDQIPEVINNLRSLSVVKKYYLKNKRQFNVKEHLNKNTQYINNVEEFVKDTTKSLPLNINYDNCNNFFKRSESCLSDASSLYDGYFIVQNFLSKFNKINRYENYTFKDLNDFYKAEGKHRKDIPERDNLNNNPITKKSYYEYAISSQMMGLKSSYNYLLENESKDFSFNLNNKIPFIQEKIFENFVNNDLEDNFPLLDLLFNSKIDLNNEANFNAMLRCFSVGNYNDDKKAFDNKDNGVLQIIDKIYSFIESITK